VGGAVLLIAAVTCLNLLNRRGGVSSPQPRELRLAQETSKP
jgi:hypothetical protein